MKKLFLVLIALLIITSVSAADIDTYTAEFNLVKNKAVVDINIEFPTKIAGTYEFQLPSDQTALSVYIDGKPALYNLEANNLKLTLNGNSKISFNYVTEEFTDKSNFLISFTPNYNINNLNLKLVLQEGATLEKPLTDADINSGSIYPLPTKATTDGKNLIFIWERENLTPEDEVSIFAQIKPKTNYSQPTIILIIIILIITTSIITIKKLKKPEKEKIIIKKEDHVEKHLKPDEEQIINVLKLKEGSCEQGTLRIATDFSKAKLSRLLKELEERKVIKKEKRGKKNLIFLKK